MDVGRTTRVGTEGGRRTITLTFLLVVTLIAAACDDTGGGGSDTTVATPNTTLDGSESTSTDPSGDGEDLELTSVTVGNPINAPSAFDWQIADFAGYFEEEGLDVEVVYTGGSGEAMQQLLGGNLDITTSGTTSIIEPLEEGFTDLRALFARVYGSIFAVAVLADSDIESAEDFAGRTIGITELSGGEVPTVRGMIVGAGLSEGDVPLLPVGEAPALIAQALTSGQIDAFGGSEADFIALEVAAGLDLRIIPAEPLVGIPSNSVVALQPWLDDNPETIEGLLRAMMKGYHWAVSNPESALAVLEQSNPEHYVDESGAITLDRYIALSIPPEGVPRGQHQPEQYEQLFNFLEADLPDVDLGTVVINDYVEVGNDFDTAAVESDAQAFLEGQ